MHTTPTLMSESIRTYRPLIKYTKHSTLVNLSGDRLNSLHTRKHAVFEHSTGGWEVAMKDTVLTVLVLYLYKCRILVRILCF